MQHLAVKLMRAAVMAVTAISELAGSRAGIEGVKSNLAALRKRSAQYSVDTLLQKVRWFDREARDRRWR
jgi:hypothetical protein